MFNKILIANRGEIAVRVNRTAQSLGYRTVAVFSEADRDAPHVKLADEAVCIGPASASESYLNVNAIIEAARKTGADAVHPGYGFLSENAGFVSACADHGITFIGPPAHAMELMGSKRQSKEAMAEAGVPTVPGFQSSETEPGPWQEAADGIGYPVMIKASAGGGGRGMRLVHEPSALADELARARSEAESAFGDGELILEKAIVRPRHIEIQVFADQQGNAIHLGERDCSVQRRHQKVVEEAPSPFVDEAMRQAMGDAAVKAAQACGYVGAGTVEFIVDESGAFYFLEMNTRLQVEHPVTEMITGQDLVEWQLRVADGEALPLGQEDIRLDGHAFEARVYAEDPAQDFMPATGRISQLILPDENEHVRIDTGVRSGDTISPYYDPMIAKLVVWDRTREQALNRLRLALRDFHVAGTVTNLDFLYRLIEIDAFAAAEVDTGFIERHEAAIFTTLETDASGDLASSAVAVLLARQHQRQQAAGSSSDPDSPWRLASGWRMNTPCTHRLTLSAHGRIHSLQVEQRAHDFLVTNAACTLRVAGSLSGSRLDIEIDGHRRRGLLVHNDNRYSLVFPGHTVEFHEVDEQHAAGEDGTDGGLSAPMNGTIVTLLVEPGDSVAAGTPLLIMEAMKMEHTVRAPTDGTLECFLFAPGDLVDGGANLADFAAAQADA